MKTVEYKGEMYEVEDWAKFIAKDDDGEVFVFDLEPHLNSNKTVWIGSAHGSSAIVYPLGTRLAGSLKEI